MKPYNLALPTEKAGASRALGKRANTLQAVTDHLTATIPDAISFNIIIPPKGMGSHIFVHSDKLVSVVTSGRAHAFCRELQMAAAQATRMDVVDANGLRWFGWEIPEQLDLDYIRRWIKDLHGNQGRAICRCLQRINGCMIYLTQFRIVLTTPRPIGVMNTFEKILKPTAAPTLSLHCSSNSLIRKAHWTIPCVSRSFLIQRRRSTLDFRYSSSMLNITMTKSFRFQHMYF